MTYDPHKHHRRSVRLKAYDYTQNGVYFVTLCSKHGQPIFGHIENGAMVLNEWGQIVEREWLQTAVLRPNVKLDTHQVMPNHFHGLFWIMNTGIETAVPTRQFGQPQKGALGTIIGAFKAAVTYAINDLRQTKDLSVWQRNYYEQVIRNERHATAVRHYITNNPTHWEADKLHPNAPPNPFNQSWPR
ncbi:MAG: transposase [Ardenticatenaceae bacterium]|nr:transposase [Ardenticatenaceae bacterium]